MFGQGTNRKLIKTSSIMYVSRSLPQYHQWKANERRIVFVLVKIFVPLLNSKLHDGRKERIEDETICSFITTDSHRIGNASWRNECFPIDQCFDQIWWRSSCPVISIDWPSVRHLTAKGRHEYHFLCLAVIYDTMIFVFSFVCSTSPKKSFVERFSLVDLTSFFIFPNGRKHWCLLTTIFIIGIHSISCWERSSIISPNIYSNREKEFPRIRKETSN